MPLTKQQLQHQNTLFGYSKVLKDTREDHLRGLQRPNLSEEETNQIWNASFVLQYMIENHKKYIRLLEALHLDKKTKAILAQLLSELTIDPAENLQGFIDQAQGLMQSEKFIASLSKLAARYNREKNFYPMVTLVSTIGVILIGFLALALTFTTPLVPTLMISIGIPLFMFTAFGSWIKHLSVLSKKDIIKNAIDSLPTKEPEDFRLTEKYVYETAQAEKNSVTVSTKTFIKTHETKTTKELRDSFLQPQRTHAKPLSTEVQENYNKLPSLCC